MKNLRDFIVKAVIAAVLVFAFSACAASSPDELYLLPQGADEYEQLQQQLNTLLSDGAEYSPPVSGNYRQTVQFEDLNMDGSEMCIRDSFLTGFLWHSLRFFFTETHL